MYMVTDRLATSVASINWRLFSRRGYDEAEKRYRTKSIDRRHKYGTYAHATKGLETMTQLEELTEIVEHPFLDMIMRPSDVGMTGYDLRKVTQLMLDMSGNALWLVQREKGVAKRAYPVPSTWVTRYPKTGEPFFVVNLPDEPGVIVPVTDCWWFRNINPANPRGAGIGLGRVLADELDIYENASKYLGAHFYNNSMPAFIASIKGAGKSALLRAQLEWEQAHTLFANAYRTKWTSGEVDVKRLDTSFRDQQLVELRDQTKKDVVHTAGVPREILGMTEDSNRATSWVARQNYAEFSVIPRAEALRHRWQAIIDKEYDDRLLLWYDSPMPRDADFVADTMSKHPTAYTENDWRELTGHLRLPGGDVHLVKQGIRVVSDLSSLEVSEESMAAINASEPAFAREDEDEEEEEDDEEEEDNPDESPDAGAES